MPDGFDGGQVDELWLQLGGNADEYEAMFAKAQTLTERTARQIMNSTDKMTASIAIELKKGTQRWEEYAASIDKARDAKGRFLKQTFEQKVVAGLSAGPVPVIGDPMRGGEPPGLRESRGLRSFDAAMHSSSDNSRRMAANLHHLHAAFGDITSMAFRARHTLGMFGEGAEQASEHVLALASTASHAVHLASAAFYMKDMARLAGGAGAATTGLGAAATTAGIALAAFTATVAGTTYAIGGMDAVMAAPGNTLELLKMLLVSATFGYVDLTEATKRQKESEEELKKVTVSSHMNAAILIADRKKLITELGDNIHKLKDHSESAEAAFKKLALHEAHRTGMSGREQMMLGFNIEAQFKHARVDDIIVKMQTMLQTYGKTEEEIRNYALAENNATKEQLARIDALDRLKRAIDTKAESERRAIEIAKADQAERQRQRDSIVDQGKSMHKALMTPLEKLQEEARQVMKLFESFTDVNAEDLRRAMEKLEKGPTEHKVHIKFVTGNQMGIEAKQFGSVEDIAGREAYKQNLAEMARAELKKPQDAETNKILTEMREKLGIIATNSDPKKSVRIQPARLGGG